MKRLNIPGWLSLRGPWRREPGVDDAFYLSTYPDVLHAGMSAKDHFFRHGWREGRDPSDKFSTIYYAFKYMKDSKLTSNPLLHARDHQIRKHCPEDLIEWERFQFCIAAEFFDFTYYLHNYKSDIGALNPLTHYLRHGWSSGMRPDPVFDPIEYIGRTASCSPDRINPFVHYIMTSKTNNEISHRSLTQITEASLDLLRNVFDANYYVTTYADVRASGIDPLHHFVNFGWKEGRNPTSWFWTKYYKDKYIGNDVINPLEHYISYGEKNKCRPNPLRSTGWLPPSRGNNEAIASICNLNGTTGIEITIIVPVYRGYEETLDCISAIFNSSNSRNIRLIVINDCSPDERLSDQLRQMATYGTFLYIENDSNLGFIKTINKGFDLSQGDIVILNSDTVVFGNWIDRLVAHAQAHPDAATITPLSNNATIASYPLDGTEPVLGLEIDFDRLDALCARVNYGGTVEAPTGVGFCMYIRREALDVVGHFDQEFGRGYGEENDFCLRAIKAGFKNLLAADVFVYHRGMVSFGEFRDDEYEPGQSLLVRRHPDYEARVSAFMAADPLQHFRIRLDLCRLALANHKGILLLTIKGLGGVIKHVNWLATRLDKMGIPVVLAEISADHISIRAYNDDNAVFCPNIRPLRYNKEFGLFIDFLQEMRPQFIHVHSFAHSRWETFLAVADYLRASKNAYYVTVHDYSPLCHRHHMTDLEGTFCEEISTEKCLKCISLDPQCLDIIHPAERISNYAKLLEGAVQVIAPSEDTVRRMQRYFPDVNFRVLEHEEFLPPMRVDRAQSRDKRVICIIGALGPHKGSKLIQALLTDVRNRQLPLEYVLIGYSDRTRKLTALGLKETGPYADEGECYRILASVQPDLVFIPSIWPETYCYALSLPLNAGVPTAAFRLGAQADRLARAGGAIILNLSLIDNPGEINDYFLSVSLDEVWAHRPILEHATYPDFLSDYYGLT